ncbi:MAG: hypothetical protein FJ014_13270 [Chloroflexi bacterium]|nr:hypothetical protein [Chloroflexota bacterium]
MTQVTLPEHDNLSHVLRVLRIPHIVYTDENGVSLMTVTLDNERYDELLDLWHHLTQIQYGYVAQIQQGHHIQLALPLHADLLTTRLPWNVEVHRGG